MPGGAPMGMPDCIPGCNPGCMPACIGMPGAMGIMPGCMPMGPAIMPARRAQVLHFFGPVPVHTTHQQLSAHPFCLHLTPPVPLSAYSSSRAPAA